MENNNFNPEKNPEQIIQCFETGPSILHLFRCSIEEGHSEVHCIDDSGKEKTFFIPKHTIGVKRCNAENSRYVLIKVALKPEDEVGFWLLTCVYSRRSYLFPSHAFNGEGIYVPIKEIAA
jgi:hypothetical protein